MKAMNKFGSALRAIGAVLVVIALVLALYNVATGSASWGKLSPELAKNGVGTGLVNRLKFDNALFGAMSEVGFNAPSATEAAAGQGKTMAELTAMVDKRFEGFVSAVNAKQPEIEKQKIEEIYTYFNDSFDAAAYGETYAKWLDSQETREEAAVISALDALAKPAGKGGKKLALAAPSCKTYMEGFYADLSAEHGEAAGSYLDFLLTVQAMIADAQSAGTAVSGAEAWMKASFDVAAYQAKIVEVQATERASEAGMLDDFAALMEKKAAGEKVDLPAFFEGVYATLQEKNPDTTVPGYLPTLTALRAKLDTGIAFDGSYGTILEAAKTTQTEMNSGNFAAFMQTYSRSVVDDASGSKVFAVLWAVSAHMVLILVLGIVLIIAGIVVKKVVYATLLNRMEKAEKEKEDAAIGCQPAPESAKLQ